MAVGEGRARLFLLGVGLHFVAHVQHGLVILFQFSGHFSCRLAFAEAAHKHHDLPGRPSASFKCRVGVQIVDRVAPTATIDNQFAVVRASKLAGLGHWSTAVWTPQAFWMKIFEKPVYASFVIE